VTTRKRKSPASREPVGDKAGSLDGGAGVRKVRWFPVAVADLDRLKHNQTAAGFAVLLAVWIVLLREAHFRRTHKVKLADSIVAERAGITRRTIIRYRGDLVATGLVLATEPTRDPTTCRYLPTTWTLRPSVPMFRASPSDNKSPGPSDNDSPGPCDSEDTTQSHRLLQSSPGGFPSQAATGEETVGDTRTRRM